MQGHNSIQAATLDHGQHFVQQATVTTKQPAIIMKPGTGTAHSIVALQCFMFTCLISFVSM